MRHATALLALPAFFLLACAQGPVPGSASGPPQPAAQEHDGSVSPLYALFHRSLKPPEGAVEVLRLHGHGFQIFRCESQPAGLRWAYRLPEADLVGIDGRLAVRHGAGLSFEHVDGSRLVGEVVDHVPAPGDNNLPWLLLRARAFGQGALAAVTYVERIK